MKRHGNNNKEAVCTLTRGDANTPDRAASHSQRTVNASELIRLVQMSVGARKTSGNATGQLRE